MDHEKDEKQLRFTFIAMLFALTIGKIAEQFTELVRVGVVFPHPAYTHLLLATCLVVTSWVGWARSSAPGNIRAVKDVFSWEFIVLLIDLFLVICYFIIVKGAEIPETKTAIKPIPSAANETSMVVVVFAGYLLWDLVTKVAIKLQPDSTRWGQLWSRYFGKKFAITGGCLVLAIIIWKLFSGTSSRFGVIAVDAMLVVLVGGFRALKQIERKSRPTEESLG